MPRTMRWNASISPYIREGSGLKLDTDEPGEREREISPYIREGSGLKLFLARAPPPRPAISPYIREGSGLKHERRKNQRITLIESPLTSVRGAD